MNIRTRQKACAGLTKELNRTPATGIPLLLLALACVQGSCAVSGNDAATTAYTRATAAYEAGDMDEARIEAATAASLDPSMLDARLLLGKAFFFLELDDQSITTLSATLRRVPRAGETALWLARAYRMADESDKAIATCETLLASDPASVAALRLRATLAMDDDDTASALRYLNMAVEASAETGMAFLDRAAIRWAFGDREGTYADLETAMMTLPRGSHALVEVGRLIDDLKALEP